MNTRVHQRRAGFFSLIRVRTLLGGPSVACVCVSIVGCLTGCLERVISITSEPPGAVVELNGIEVGTTPVQTEFTYFGQYDVRLRQPGYEAIHTEGAARMPWYEYPPIDLVAAALPFTFQTNIDWHYELEPTTASTDTTIDRARAFRAEATDAK